MASETNMEKGAEFNKDRRHRLCLWRIWGDNGKYVNFVMLNPSTADEQKNDRTISKCIELAKNNGYDGIFITNLFSFVSRHPGRLYEEDQINLEISDKYIENIAKKCSLIVCAWGSHGKSEKLKAREKEVLQILSNTKKSVACLKINKGGAPKHPLYCKKVSPFLVFRYE